MENREILIANTKTQKRSKITTDATTLGELKAALDNAGVDYSGMTFTEGISKTQLLDDATQLPQNVMYKGNPTNNLVILLTNTKKNIASGIYAGDRKACYSIVKDYGLQDAIKEVFGKNFTQVTTVDLQDFIAKHTEDDDSCDDDSYSYNASEDEDSDYDVEDEGMSTKKPNESNDIVEAIYKFVKVIVDIKVLSKDNVNHLIHSLSFLVDNMDEDTAPETKSAPVSTSDGRITDDDINDMIDDLDI